MRISDWSSDVCSSDLECRRSHRCGVPRVPERAGRGLWRSGRIILQASKAVISFRPSSPLKMTMMAKHSSIATIKSRKNRGALLPLLASATMLVMGAPVSAKETPDFEAIRSVDKDIAEIGCRLATANAPVCDRQETIYRK